MLDVRDENVAYIIGFMQGDGNHSEDTRNRGRLRIELQERDKQHLDTISLYLNSLGVSAKIGTRERTTNFKEVYRSVQLSVYDYEFREWIKPHVPVGKKDHIIRPPEGIHERGYWRGIIDADGSVSVSAANIPLVSLVTTSDELKKTYCEYIRKHLGTEKNVNRNKRDQAYNIVLYSEDAQKMCRILYEDCTLALDRKKKNAYTVMSWSRPPKRMKRNKRAWTEEEDQYVLSHTIDESCMKTGRTKRSIAMRLWRLRNGITQGNLREEHEGSFENLG